MTNDATLGGYERVHQRPPAFEGSDGLAYTAEVFVDDAPDADGRYGAALLFVRWSRGGDRADGVLETACLASESTAGAAADAVRRLDLLDVKRLLEEAITSPPGSARD